MTDLSPNNWNGTRRWRARLSTVKRRAAMPSALLLVILLTACAPTRATVTTGNSFAAFKARCSGWRAISFSAKGDTPRTIKEVRTHNQTGKNKKCWK